LVQVEHTFALFEAGYGIMNEHQVAIGESTCAAKLWAAPTTAGGKAMIEARELTRIALERSRTAREAVETMGALAEKYGFYAADWSGGDDSKGEGGEALTVVDPDEAWVFHVLSDDLGTGAVWAAQRLADDHVSPGPPPHTFLTYSYRPPRWGRDQHSSSSRAMTKI
jgi:dipeptidase